MGQRTKPTSAAERWLLAAKSNPEQGRQDIAEVRDLIQSSPSRDRLTQALHSKTPLTYPVDPESIH